MFARGHFSGFEGIKEAGASSETRLAKKDGSKGKNFADLLRAERVLFEMKSRGKKLERHYDQTGGFPWPQTPTRPQIEAVAREAVALRALRREVMAKMKWSLRDLYRTLEEPGANPLREAQTRLDEAVRAAYGMAKDADILAFLLELNLACAPLEAAGQPITPPGLPLPESERAAVITDDCIRV